MTWLPAHIRAWLADIERGTGQTPAVERVSDRRFRITVESERVLMTVDFKTTGPGRWVWASSTLTVDGQRRPLAENAAAFYRLFHDPDSGGRRRVDPADEEVFEPYPLDNPPPPAIQAAVAQLAAKLAKVDAEVVAGRLANGTPVVVASFARGYLRMYFGAKVYMRAVVDGFDETGPVATDVAAVVRRLLDAHDPAQPPPAAPGRARAARPTERDTGVEVRRTTVIRT